MITNKNAEALFTKVARGPFSFFSYFLDGWSLGVMVGARAATLEAMYNRVYITSTVHRGSFWNQVPGRCGARSSLDHWTETLGQKH